MAENAVLFLAYSQIQQLIRFGTGTKEADPLSTTQLCFAGGLSGAVVSYVLTPVELLKCRLQMQDYLPELAAGGKRHRGALSLFRHIIRNEGVSGLYRGHTGTVLREVAGGAAWFGVYEMSVKKMIQMSPKGTKKHDLSAWQLMGAGALAGMSYNADVIKSRIQSGLHNNESFCTVAKSIYHQQGVRGFFRGFGITVARSAPSSGVIFLTYELLSRKLG
ncbi:hypothetical protein HDV01_007345 [Terramyces sp. JEL0728]|nr:hypothetical protein HDV01_007345 [Terramyces sp. JEL0728]